MQNTSEKSLEAILKMPLTGLQHTLINKIASKKYEETELQNTIQELVNNTPPLTKQRADIEREKENIKLAIENGIAPNEPNLSTKELQLLWAANLSYLALHSDTPIQNTKLWRQLTDSYDAKHYLMKYAFYLSRDAINPKTRLRWGDPDSSFYYNPEENIINIDFLASLICGLDDTGSIIFHEVAHSKLTKNFTERMQEIRQKMEALNEKVNKGSLTKEENTTLSSLATEWQFRYRVFGEAENSVVNRYVINLGKKLSDGDKDKHSLDVSLNIVETTFADAGNYELPTELTAEAKFRNLTRAIRMSLYKNNELFEDTPQGWERIGVIPEWIEALPHPDGVKLTSQEAFKELLELCGGKKGLENLQPGTLDRMRGTNWLSKMTDEYSHRRNAIIEDIFTRYAEPLIKQMIQEAKDKLMDQMQQNQQSQNGEQQGEQQGKGQSQGQPSEGQGKGSGNSTPVEGAGNMPNVEMPPQTPQEAKERAVEKNKQKSGSEQNNEDKKEELKNGKDKTDDKDPVPNDEGNQEKDVTNQNKEGNTEDNPEQKEEPTGANKNENEDSEDKKQSPEEGKSKKSDDNNEPDNDIAESNDSNNKSAANDNESKEPTIESLLKELENLQRSESRQQQNGNEQQIQKLRKSSKPGGGAGVSSANSRPKMGNWKDYQDCVATYGPEIRQARNMLVQIQEKQSQLKNRMSHQRTMLPEDGDMDRFDESTHVDLLTKMYTGQKVGEEEIKRFNLDEEYNTPATITAVLLIDGSFSMYQKRDNERNAWPFSPIEVGIQTGCIFNEAAKQPRKHGRQSRGKEGDINALIGVWGNDPPLFIAKPGDDPIKVGRAIAGLKQSLDWGTSLAPALKHTTKELSEYKAPPNSPIGFTHFIIISDGDIADASAAKIALERLLENCKRTTFDVVVIQKNQTKMDGVVKEMINKHTAARVGLKHCERTDNAQQAILDLLRERMLATGYSQSVPFAQQQKDLKKAFDNMR